MDEAYDMLGRSETFIQKRSLQTYREEATRETQAHMGG